MGGQWVGMYVHKRGQRQVMDLLGELGLEVYPYQGHEVTGLKVLRELRNGSIVESTFAQPSLSILQLMELFLLISEINIMSQMICKKHLCTPTISRPLDSISVQGFLDSKLPGQDVCDLLTVTCRIMFGVELCNVSYLHFVSLVKRAGSLEKLVHADPTSAQGFVIKNGAQQISLKLSEIIGKDRIHLSSPVSSITQQNDGLYKVTTKTHRTFLTKYVIVAIPPNMIARLHIEPPLPASKLHCLSRLTPGYIVKTIITYSRNFWIDHGHSGEVITMGQTSHGPVTLCFTGTGSRGGHALVIFCGGDQAVYWSQTSEKERKAATLSQLTRYFGEQIHDYIVYREMDWLREPYTEVSPVCCPCPGGMLYHTSLHTPHNRIYFAGTETADSWIGFMNGAVQAGTRAAAEVLHDHNPSALLSDDHQYTHYHNQHKTCAPKFTHYLQLRLVNFGWMVIHFIRFFIGR